MNLMRSRVGRAFIAIRDQDIAAEIIGINIFRYKLLAFAISSFYAGVTGVLYTYFLGIANYEQFQIGVSIDYLAMIIIGGLGSVLGSIFGAIFVTLLPIVIRYAMEAFGGVFFSRNRAQPHPQPPPHAVRRSHHRLPDRGARGAEPSVAEHPQLLPRLAVRVLSTRGRRKHMRQFLAIATALIVAAGSLLRGRSVPRPVQGRDRHRRAVRPHRADPDRRHGPVPGLPRLHRPRELQGRRRGPQDQGPRDRPRVQGAAGRRVLRAPQEGRRRDDGDLRHAADLRAGREADGGPDPRHLAGLRQRRRRRRRSAIRTSSRSPRPTGRRAPPRSTSSRSSSAAASRARRSPTSSTTTRPAGSRSRSSRTSRRRKASSSRPSRCRRPASRWAPRCSTSRSASAPTS